LKQASNSSTKKQKPIKKKQSLNTHLCSQMIKSPPSLQTKHHSSQSSSFLGTLFGFLVISAMQETLFLLSLKSQVKDDHSKKPIW